MNSNLDIPLTYSEEDEIYKENILDHYKNPRNFGTLDPCTIKNQEQNTSCGDRIEINLILENNKVKDAKFCGEGCAISIAGASMLTEKIRGMEFEKLKSLKESELLEMIGVPLGVVRMKCGLLSLKVLKKGISKMEAENE